MVRAILYGGKKQTRRVVKMQPPATTRDVFTYHHPDPREHFYAFDGDALLDWAYPCPYGEIGDRLHVRETWQHSNHPLGPYDDECHVFYRADYMDDPHGPDGEKSPEGKYREWRPSIHMPRAASRIALEITGTRVERLQSISEADAEAEGINFLRSVPDADERLDARSLFHYLWDGINGDGAWAANPWVWVVEFKRAA
ncbi:hypothetical protein NOV72_03692 [Caballeronia novacaledonica]|uniref:Phage-related protein n=1 Tax=Caballeronia novacaledonica TaxID=1544861 RepID=A0A2U3I8G4_9BURK|nr:hypothetical protein [Caballeronia novacaledonica]SPB16492.1 hypothetical protein NOV72_03692 [Caballeronia novacaledonica]